MRDGQSDVFDRDCLGRVVLNHLTSRWGLLVLVALRDGPMRFYELRNLVDGVSEKMLSQTLRTLTRDGLLAREVMATSPPSVRYALTPLGVDAAEPLQQVLQWVRRNATTVCRSQESYDEQNHGDA
ncbi:helix-turn-helix transcriptional regulator [Frankia sp. CNm7]|nr:helix-turn-helix transcriptional regulator [Frankia nepalensis]MBL7512971.1 helix-turn-helix transcriptional regulator [Frankia nepalensis]MBL7521323.1 helix-turn-helix transcriptional regulator [Frankia nepalensis]